MTEGLMLRSLTVIYKTFLRSKKSVYDILIMRNKNETGAFTGEIP